MSDERVWTITPAKIVEETGINRSVLNRFMEEPGVRRWLGGETTHPAYPETSLPAFHWLAKKYDQGMKPKAMGLIVAGWPVGVVPDEGPVTAQSLLPAEGAGTELEAAMPPVPALLNVDNPQVNQLISYISETLSESLVSRIQAAGILPRQEDRLLTRAQAAELLACEPAAVGRRVKPVSRETWSYLMIQDYIDGLRQKAAEKARSAAEKRLRKVQKTDG